MVSTLVNGKYKRKENVMTKETDCRKGTTAFELLTLLGIIAILAFVAGLTVNSAHGMETQKLLPADNATVEMVVGVLKKDPHVTVTVMAYSASWTIDTVDLLLGRAKQVLSIFHEAGIYRNRVTLLLANKGGMSDDPMPTPTTDGVYLYFD
jgi:heme/copper-type cytochrome/quinol oxidase subunit 2